MSFSSSPTPFLTSVLYALNVQYAATRCEAMREISSEKTQSELEAAQVWLKEKDEELNSAKEALSVEELKQVDAEMERRVAEYTKTVEFDLIVGKESAAAVVNFVDKFQGEFPQLLDLFNRFKVDWSEYFEVHPSLNDLTSAQSQSISNETIAKLAKTVVALEEDKKQKL
ncbi:hypothetical protein LIER_19560 [Lithospermum erythrorhizon]|uniref:Uncharacterized protein n=1 Tax=Lithospermum erythrorhizon TaxID=34254 RepID=A0AAV3QL71_LITER